MLRPFLIHCGAMAAKPLPAATWCMRAMCWCVLAGIAPLAHAQAAAAGMQVCRRGRQRSLHQRGAGKGLEEAFLRYRRRRHARGWLVKIDTDACGLPEGGCRHAARPRRHATQGSDRRTDDRRKAARRVARGVRRRRPAAVARRADQRAEVRGSPRASCGKRSTCTKRTSKRCARSLPRCIERVCAPRPSGADIATIIAAPSR